MKPYEPTSMSVVDELNLEQERIKYGSIYPHDLLAKICGGEDTQNHFNLNKRFQLQTVMEFLEEVDPNCLGDLRSLTDIELQDLIAISDHVRGRHGYKWGIDVDKFRASCVENNNNPLSVLLKRGRRELVGFKQFRLMVQRIQQQVTSTIPLHS